MAPCHLASGRVKYTETSFWIEGRNSQLGVYLLTMESPRSGQKRRWASNAGRNDDPAHILVDDLKLDSSFLEDDFLDLPPLGNDSILTIDSASDVFADLDLFQGDFAVDEPLDFDQFLGEAKPQVEPRTRASPSTSESGNIAVGEQPAGGSESRGSEPRTCSGGSGAADGGSQGEDEAKRLARMQRNRENAFLSRQRKKQQMMELQQTCTHLRGQTTQLTCLVHRLVAENCLLRHHLGTACKQAIMPVPDVPSAMKAACAGAILPPTGLHGSVVQPMVSVTTTPPGVIPVLAPGAVGMQQPGGTVLMQQGMRPTAPLQPANNSMSAGGVAAAPQGAVKPAAPTAPAPTAAANPAAPIPAVSGRPTRNKRVRVTGAGAAFLALFSVFLFVSPFSPGGTSRTTLPVAPTGSVTGLLPVISTDAIVGVLDSASAHPMAPITRGKGGRSLLQKTATIEDSDPLPKPLPMPASLVNQTIEALLQDPRTQKVPAEALQRLQDLAPAAVLLEPTEQKNIPKGSATGKSTTTGASPLAAATAFPTLADQFFKAAGLDAPQACQKVFEFDAATIPHPARSRRSVEKFITGAYGFKGRSMGLPEASSSSKGSTLQLPAAKGAASDSESSLVLKGSQQPLLLGGGSENDAATNRVDFEDEPVDPRDALPITVNEPTLVSVLLPANASKSGEFGGLTAIDRVFVVLLHPGDRFLTYSCGLSRPLLV